MAISLVSDSVAALRINEIMYDPQYNENYNEWIEIYNDGESVIDLANYTLCNVTLAAGFIEQGGNVSGEPENILEPGKYALITDGGSGTQVYDNYNVEESALAFHVLEPTICSRLNNDGDTITIADAEGILIANVSYEDAAAPGFSLEFRDGDFFQSALVDGTPGRENSAGSSHNDSNNNTAPPQNNTSNNSTRTDNNDTEVDTSPRIRTDTPSFIPLGDPNPVPSNEKPQEKKKIVLSRSQENTLPVNESYITPEGKLRQTIVYVFAGFCIVLTLLIVLKKV